MYTKILGFAGVLSSSSAWAGGSITPDAGGPYTVPAEAIVTLTAESSSFGGDCADDVDYRWDLNGDGEYDTTWSTLATATYSAAGFDGPTSVLVAVAIRSGGDSCDIDVQTDTATVNIENVAPSIVSVTGPTTAAEGSSTDWVVTYSDVEASDTHSVSWDFDDGTVGGTEAISHTWSDDGIYVVSVQVTDDDGGIDVAETTVSISNVAPTIVSSSIPATGSEGQSLVFSASATDPGDDPLTYSWSFGDGSTATGAIVTHAYADNGGYPVILTVSDGDGGSAGIADSVVISNVPPVASMSGPTSASEGELASWEVSIVDAGSADVHVVTWDFGDGSTAVGRSASHVYGDNGSYSVSAVICDDDGACDTASTSVSISNAAPVVASVVGGEAAEEGVPTSFSCIATDPGSADTLSYGWDFGDGSSASGSTVTHTFADDGTYMVACTVTDDDGASTSSSTAAVVANQAPVLLTMSGAMIGDEGDSFSMSATASDPGADTLTYMWDFGDGATAEGASVSHVWADNGSFGVTLTIADEDGGVTTGAEVATISNLAPTVTIAGDLAGEEASSLAFGPGLVDAGTDDTHTCVWSFGDGSSETSVGGVEVFHTYPEDGTYSLSVTCIDDDGGIGADSVAVDVSNVAPTVASLSGSAEGSEGGVFIYACEATDPGADDTVSIAWDFGDESTGTGSPVSHVFTDDAEFVVTCVATDTDGASTSAELTTMVVNLDPEISGTPEDLVAEGSVYSFTPSVSDPGTDDTHSWSGVSPEGAVIDSETGSVDWTPIWSDVGTHSFTLEAIDDDGGVDSLTWSVEVSMTDVDEDGLSDTWEEEFELDPTDPADAMMDLDGDGRASIDEFEAGTDPTEYDGPGVPTLSNPSDGAEVAELEVILEILNADSPQSEELLYSFEVFSNETMSTLVEALYDVAEGEEGRTVATLAEHLEENTWYWWWASAADLYTHGDWSDAGSFFYNTVNDMPGAPGIDAPFDGSSIANTLVTLALDSATDPDGDPLSYTFVLTDVDGTVIATAAGINDDGEDSATWDVDVELLDGTEYCWTAFATDDEGLDGEVSLESCFIVDLTNEAPSAPLVLSPAEGSAINTLTVEIVVDNGLDPEGRATEHLFEIDTDPSFGSADLQQAAVATSEDGTTVWTTMSMPDDALMYVRVRCSDGAAYSDWAESSFMVNTSNDAPSVPTLHNPADGAAFAEGDALEVVNSEDIDGDALTYDFAIFDEDGVELQAESGVAESDSGYTAWMPAPIEPGVYTWTVRAVDAIGLPSDWSTAFSFEVLGEPEAEDEEPDGSEIEATGGEAAGQQSKGCGCSSSPSNTSSLLFVSFIVGVALARRRERGEEGIPEEVS